MSYGMICVGCGIAGVIGSLVFLVVKQLRYAKKVKELLEGE